MDTKTQSNVPKKEKTYFARLVIKAHNQAMILICIRHKLQKANDKVTKNYAEFYTYLTYNQYLRQFNDSSEPKWFCPITKYYGEFDVNFEPQKNEK